MLIISLNFTELTLNVKKEELGQAVLNALRACFSVLNFYKVNLHQAFDKMILASEAFVEKNKLK